MKCIKCKKNIFGWLLLVLLCMSIIIYCDYVITKNYNDSIERDSFLKEFCHSKGYEDWAAARDSFIENKLYCYKYELDSEGIGKIRIQSNIFYERDIREKLK